MGGSLGTQDGETEFAYKAWTTTSYTSIHHGRRGKFTRRKERILLGGKRAKDDDLEDGESKRKKKLSGEFGKKNDLGRDRTCNLLIRSQTPCHWATRPH